MMLLPSFSSPALTKLWTTNTGLIELVEYILISSCQFGSLKDSVAKYHAVMMTMSKWTPLILMWETKVGPADSEATSMLGIHVTLSSVDFGIS